MRHRFTAGLLALTVGTGLVGLGSPAAHASSKGRKNSTIGRRAYRYYRGNGSPYRTYNPYGGIQYPAGYQGLGGRFLDSGTQCPPRYQQSTYAADQSLPFVTDEMGNRRYYDPREGDGYHRHDGRPYGWSGFVSRYQVDTQNSPYAATGNQDCPPGQSYGPRQGWRRR
jgi:hypothetical protein